MEEVVRFVLSMDQVMRESPDTRLHPSHHWTAEKGTISPYTITQCQQCMIIAGEPGATSECIGA